jgi:hypothetical protein
MEHLDPIFSRFQRDVGQVSNLRADFESALFAGCTLRETGR